MKDKTFPEVPETENQNEDPEVFAVQWQGGKVKISRRNLLKAGGVFAAGATLAGCYTEDDSEEALIWNCENVFAHEHQITKLAFTPDGQWALSIAENEPSLKLWSFPDGDILRAFKATGISISSFVISPGGEFVYGVDQSGYVFIGSLPDTKEVNHFTIPESLGDPSGLYLSPNEQFLAISGRQDAIAIYSLPDGNLLHSFEHPGAQAQIMLKFSPDSQYLASFFNFPSTHYVEKMVWSLADGEAIIKADSKSKIDPEFSPDSKYCFCPLGKEIEIFSLPEGELIHTLQSQDSISAMVMNTETDQLLTCDDNGIVKIWSIPDANEVISLDTDFHDGFYYSLAERENLLATAWETYDNDKKVSLTSLVDGKEIIILDIEYPSAIVEFSPNEKYFTVIENEFNKVSKLRLYNIESKDLLIDQTTQGNLSVAYSPDSRYLLVGDGLGKMNVYSLENGESVACMVDLAASAEDAEGHEYTIEVEGETVTYTLPCGSPLPTGAVCVCDCVSGSGCACVGHTTCSCVGHACSCVSHSSGTHYWYPN